MPNRPSPFCFRLSDVCRVALFAVLTLSAARPTMAAAPYWPRFHGPAGDNKSPATGLLKEWPEGGPELVWTAEGLGEGFASVSLAHGNIYTAGNIDEQTVVMALDLDGRKVWQTACGEAWTKSHSGTRSTPTIDGDRLYYETPLGDLVCLNAHTGQRIWGLNILDQFAGKNIRWALAESPVVDGDLLICCPFGDLGSVVALNKKTGKTVWAAESVGDRAGYATPAIAEFAGRRMVLTMSSKALVGVDISNGDLLFRHEHITRYDVNALTPICVDGHVFISSGYGSGSELVKLTATEGRITAEQVWENKDLDNHHGGVVLLDGHVYGADFRRYWLCLDWETGQTEYQERGVGKGSLTYADGMLYTLSEKRGTVGLVKPTPAEHKLVSEFTIPEGGEGPVWAHPVVCDGRLYIRHGDLLFAFDVKQ
ncbi:MAG: PQQ-binding-like beta-propeller repeat protein [Planctomycetota bacterium]